MNVQRKGLEEFTQIAPMFSECLAVTLEAQRMFSRSKVGQVEHGQEVWLKKEILVLSSYSKSKWCKV